MRFGQYLDRVALPGIAALTLLVTPPLANAQDRAQTQGGDKQGGDKNVTAQVQKEGRSLPPVVERLLATGRDDDLERLARAEVVIGVWLTRVMASSPVTGSTTALRLQPLPEAGTVPRWMSAAVKVSTLGAFCSSTTALST